MIPAKNNRRLFDTTDPLEVERRAAAGAAFICLALILVQGLMLLDAYYGDPNIYLSYARNIARGDLFSFNPGEFSSGSTGPLWALVLAGSFLFPQSVLVAKLLSLATTLLAFWLTYRACLKLGGSPVASVLASGVVSWRGAFYGHMMYESSLLQCELSLMLWLTADLLNDRAARSFRREAALAVVWGAVSLTRPDAVVLVALSFLVLARFRWRDRPALLRLLLTAFVAALPGFFYYGYSHVATGHLSVSAAGRGLTLLRNAPSIAGFRFSLDPLRALMASPLVIVVGFALWAWERHATSETTRRLLAWCGLTVLAHVFLLTFVVPATMSQGRYLLPALPFLAAMAGVGLSDMVSAGFRRQHRWMMIGLIGVLLFVPAFGALRMAKRERDRAWDFEIVMEQGAADWLNAEARPGASVLTHEVQIRYGLRDDLRVLSIDGITDAKILPFIESGDIRGFLLRYRPDYWVANESVFTRPYLANTPLHQAVEAIGDREHASVEVEGIGFTNLRVNREEPVWGFAGYRQLFALSYPGEGGDRAGR